MAEEQKTEEKTGFFSKVASKAQEATETQAARSKSLTIGLIILALAASLYFISEAAAVVVSVIAYLGFLRG